jgi:CheY-like chemotaxis protein
VGDGKKMILIVEDNADNRLLVRALLAHRYRFVECEDGTAALAAMQNERPDLVLLDVSLPGMDGREVLTRIRSDNRLVGVPVIALTAHAMSGDRRRYLELGFDDYVSKPITDAEAFRHTVDVHVRG